MDKFKETLEITQSGKVESMHNENGEIVMEYEIVSDETDSSGERTIKIKPSPRDAEVKRKRNELVNTLLQRLGEKDSKAFSALLENAIRQYGYNIVEELHKRVVAQQQPVKAKKGCFELVIGKGRGKFDRIQLA